LPSLAGAVIIDTVPPDPKEKKPWGGFGYLIIVVLAILAAYFIVLPIGLEVRGVFQKLTNALQGK